MIGWFAAACLAGFAIPAGAAEAVVVLPYASPELNLAGAKEFAFELQVNQPVEMAVAIATTDRDPVRELAELRRYEAGRHRFAWNGRDAGNAAVPNEAYFPLLSFREGGKLRVLHPADYSGGEVVEPRTSLSQPTSIHFRIDRPARILARAGIKAGPLMRTLAVWNPYPAGSSRIVWDGYDESRRYRVIEDSGYAVMVTGFALPDHAILVTGSSSEPYPRWRRKQGWPSASADHAMPVTAERDGKALSRAFFSPQYQPYDPRVTFSWVGQQREQPTLSGPATVRVDIPKDDRAVLESNLFEVGFFVDGEFVSEEEQGYVPFTWRFDTGRFGAGQHVLTVNISGFSGQVGTASLRFKVPGPTQKHKVSRSPPKSN
ncbi:hypothetical protein D0B54_12990 [Solimonas sp. K1W22B-7]|nr:hypothetical protein D0B54_12990 [Solimonas sp. K1W22B-7]